MCVRSVISSALSGEGGGGPANADAWSRCPIASPPSAPSVASGAAYTTAVRGQFCIDDAGVSGAAFKEECACCVACYNWNWDAVAPPMACHACYLCLRRVWRAAITPATLQAVTATESAQGRLECSKNRKYSFKGPKYACWPHTQVWGQATA